MAVTPEQRLTAQIEAARADERELLGELLRNPHRIASAASGLRAEHFIDFGHRCVYGAICGLWEARASVTLESVLNQLRRDGHDRDVTPADLADIWDCGGVGLSVGRLSRFMRTRAVLRNLRDVAAAVSARAEAALANVATGSEGEEAVSEAYALLSKCSDGAFDGGPRHVREVVSDVYARLDRRAQGAEAAGFATGFADLDPFFGGFRPQELVVLAARPSVGKAQPLTCRVLTPDGFRLMGDIEVGDSVTGSDGRPCRVLGVYPQGELDVYRVTFSDGTATECCADHLWFTRTRNEQRRGLPGSVKELREIAATLTRQDRAGPNHAVPLVGPVEYAGAESRELKIHPYAMGLLLGDGSFSGSVKFSNPEPDMRARLAALLPGGDKLTVADNCKECCVRRGRRNGQSSETKKAIEFYGLSGHDSLHKFIPPDYLRAKPADRLELLRGLFDTDGSVILPSGNLVEYGTSSPRLARDVAELARSLGAVVSVKERVPYYTYKGARLAGAPSFRLIVTFPDGTVPVSSAKHLAKWRGRTRNRRRTVVSVEPAGRKECRCIRVDAPDSLYVTDDFLVTHNTAYSLELAIRVAKAGGVVLFASLEQPDLDLVERALAAEGHVLADDLRRGKLAPAQVSAVTRAGDRLSKLAVWVDDAPAQDLVRLAADAERVRAAEGRLDLVVVDYLQLVKPPQLGRRQVTHTEQLSEVSKGLKQLARTIPACVLALAQLNRDVEQRGGRPKLSDLKGSGQIEQDADCVFLLHREGQPEPGKPQRIEVIVAKQRNGPTFDAAVEFDGATYSFGDAPPPGYADF
jgi:replicative DNA helicase